MTTAKAMFKLAVLTKMHLRHGQLDEGAEQVSKLAAGLAHGDVDNFLQCFHEVAVRVCQLPLCYGSSNCSFRSFFFLIERSK